MSVALVLSLWQLAEASATQARPLLAPEAPTSEEPVSPTGDSLLTEAASESLSSFDEIPAGRRGTDLSRTRSGPSPRGALLRSAVLPGWGQLRTGHPWKAALFCGTAAFLGAEIREEARQANTEADRARASTDPAEYELHRERYDDHRGRRRSYVSWLLFLWFYNVLDAYVEGHFVDFDVSPADPDADTKPGGALRSAGGEEPSLAVGFRVRW